MFQEGMGHVDQSGMSEGKEEEDVVGVLVKRGTKVSVECQDRWGGWE